MGIVGGLVDELLHGCGEQIKGVMQQHITTPNHPENAFKILILQRAIFELAALGGTQLQRCSAPEGCVFELWRLDRQQAHQIIKA